ncbi:MAG TPA: 2-oxoacid:acceptor oxidoreductase family protein [Acidobacteriota bacterium]|nr:2-oxoacid:acceptor oxidoreductase family protein [Acidobacteriota bacterium]
MTQLLDKVKVPHDRFELRLSGSGGQGMILGAVILSEAAGTGDAKNVVQTQSYGPEARGGASRSDIVMSANEIFYPKAMKLDLLLAMTQEALDRYYPDLAQDGTLVVDSGLVTHLPTENYYGFPFTELARTEAGHIMVANVIALAAISELTGIVSRASLTKAVLRRAPRGTEEKNRKALEIGFREAAEAKTKRETK